jgi:hypothetical protein
MSDPERFLSRWSRRKRETGQQANAEPVSEPHGQEPAAQLEPEAGNLSASADAPPRDVDSLPAVESISAETDIRGFLFHGVPAELTQAALRRAWSADPTIRDFVGLADYDWDFNSASMPGFGPFQATEAVHRMVARSLSGGGQRGGQEADTAADQPDRAQIAETQAAATLANASTEARQTEGEHRNEPAEREEDERHHTDGHEDSANNMTKEVEIRRSRGHGGALPQ